MLQPQQEAFVHSEQAGTRRRAPVVTDRGRPFPAGRSRSGLSVEAGTLGRIYWFIGMWQQESVSAGHLLVSHGVGLHCVARTVLENATLTAALTAVSTIVSTPVPYTSEVVQCL